MHKNLSHPAMEERKMQVLRHELLRKMTDEEKDAKYVCVRCGCAFHARNGRITCPFCGLEYVPNIG